MTELNLHIPITKVDAAKRLVYGVATAEIADRAGEICDYESTKPLYQKWSADFVKTSAGKSFGNLRSMHGHVAAGKLTAINCNDAAKQIEICAKVVDDAEWNKVVEGVYTGFSQGGAYVKRWKDGGLTRYTAEPHEVSLVDVPCLAGATFEMIKADGGIEARPFKNAGDGEAAVEAEEGDPIPEVTQIAKKIDTPISGDEYEQVWRSKRDRACFGKKAELEAHHAKLDVDAMALKAAKPVLETLNAISEKLESALKRPMAKGMYDVARLAGLIEELEWLQNSSAYEEETERGDSKVPQELRDLIGRASEILRNMVSEETAELAQSNAGKIMTVKSGDCDFEKRGEPSSMMTSEDLIAGLSTDSSRQMAAALKSQLEVREAEVMKSYSDSVVALLMPKLDDIAKRVKSIEDQPLPLPYGGPPRAVEKGHESKSEMAGDEALEAVASDPELLTKLIKIAQSRPIPLIARG